MEQEKTIGELEQQMESTRQSLIVMCGWKGSDRPKIGTAPETDMSVIHEIDPEGDQQLALDNNYTLQVNKRRLENAKAADKKASLEKTIAGNERQIRLSVTNAWQNLKETEAAYEQALSARDLEVQNQSLAERKWAAGMSVPVCKAVSAMSGEQKEEDQGDSYEAVDGNQISQERLGDGGVEYDELGSLIHYGNPSVQKITDSTESTRQDYQEIRDYLRTERASAKEEKKKAKEENDMESYTEYASLEAVYSSLAKSYNEMIKKLNRYSSNRNRLSVEKQMTQGAQNLMISWQSVVLQKEYLAFIGSVFLWAAFFLP